MRLELVVPAIFVECFCPWLKRHFADSGSAGELLHRFGVKFIGHDEPLIDAAVGKPQAELSCRSPKVHTTVRPARCWLRRSVSFACAYFNRRAQLPDRWRRLSHKNGTENTNGKKNHDVCSKPSGSPQANRLF